MNRTFVSIAVAMCAACHSLPDLGVCGNGVVEADLGEACDGGTQCNERCELLCSAGACDDGRSCGIDNVCRAPSGLFRLRAERHTFQAANPIVGDVDGDGADDIVATTIDDIITLFGAIDAPLATQTQQVSPAADSPVAFFTEEERSTLSFLSSRNGIARFDYDTDASRFVPHVIGPLRVDGGSEATTLFIGTALQLVSVSRDGNVDVLTGAGGASPCRPAGVLDHVVRLVATSPDRTALAVIGTEQAGGRWFLCTYVPSGPASFTQANLVVTEQFVPTHAVFANVVDDAADDCDDLVLADGAIVKRIKFSGATCSTATQLPDVITASVPLLATELAGTADELELVTSLGFARAASVDSQFFAALAPWTAATVADLDGDRSVEVVAARIGAATLDVVRSRSPFNVFQIETALPVRKLRGGDYDGDGFGDVALVEGFATSQRLAVAYGRAGNDIDTFTMSGFAFKLDISTGNIPALNPTSAPDVFEDLVLAVRLPSQAEVAVGLIVGAPNRALAMPRPGAGPVVEPFVIGAGRFSRGTASGALVVSNSQTRIYDTAENILTGSSSSSSRELDLGVAAALVHRESDFLVMSSRALGQRSLIAVNDAQECTHPLPNTDIFDPPPRPTSVDLDGDGLDELVFVTPGGVAKVAEFSDCGISAATLPGELCVDYARAGDLLAICGTSLENEVVRGDFRIERVSPVASGIVTLDDRPLRLLGGDFNGDGLPDAAVIFALRTGEIVVQVLQQCPAHDVRDCS